MTTAGVADRPTIACTRVRATIRQGVGLRAWTARGILRGDGGSPTPDEEHDVQDQLFDPWAEDRSTDAQRRRLRITPAQAEQLVLDLVTRAGGRIRGEVLLRAGHDAGLDTDAVAHAVHVLERARRVRADGNVVALLAA